MKDKFKLIIKVINKYKTMPLVGGVVFVIYMILKALGCLMLGVCLL